MQKLLSPNSLQVHGAPKTALQGAAAPRGRVWTEIKKMAQNKQLGDVQWEQDGDSRWAAVSVIQAVLTADKQLTLDFTKKKKKAPKSNNNNCTLKGLGAFQFSLR